MRGGMRNDVVSLEIKVERGNDQVEVQLSGDVDMASSHQLQAEFRRVLRERPRHLVVDVTKASIADNVGASTFIQARSEARLVGVNLRLTNAPRVRGEQ